MIIRILPSLANRQQWIEFCRREVPYCFVRQPDTLVDFQSCHLVITLLNRQVRNGRDAVKYSIGSRHTMEPAWQFIKACRFDLTQMVEGLERIDFQGNVRDNSRAGFVPDVNIRKFFAKEQAVISPAFLGPLEPLSQAPDHWELHHCCRLLANDQFEQLRLEKKRLDDKPVPAPNPNTLLVALVERPERWKVRIRNQRLWLLQGQTSLYSLRPLLEAPQSPTAQPRLTAAKTASKNKSQKLLQQL